MYTFSVSVLEWWKDLYETNGLELKYTEKAMNTASKHGSIYILEWWAQSGLPLKYSRNFDELQSRPTDNISSIITDDIKQKTIEVNRKQVLDWWQESGLLDV